MSRYPRSASASRATSKPVIKSKVYKTRPCSAKQMFEAQNHRRNEEAWKLEEWKLAVHNNEKREWQAKYHNMIAEKPSRNIHENDWKAIENKENALQEKKNRLRKLLKADEEMYETERQRRGRKFQLENNQQIFYPEVEMLKKKLDDLKKKNDEEKQKISDKLSYEIWKKNNHESLQLESQRLNKFVQDAWVDQKQWKEDQRRRREEEVRKTEKDELERIHKEMEAEAKLQEEKKLQKAKWKAELDEQLRLVREREEEEKHLKREEELLLKERNKLVEFLRRREEYLQSRKRKDLELFWARQHQLKLKKKSVIIQNELMQDQDLMEDLLKGFSRDSVCTTLQNEKYKEEIDWLKSVLEEQKKLEKLREKEYDLLFSEEARQMWEKRQAEWDRERRARDKLMQDVFNGLQKQIDAKSETLTDCLNKSKEKRTILLSEIQLTQKKLSDEEKILSSDALKYENRSNISQKFQNGKVEQYENYLREKRMREHREEISRIEAQMKELWSNSYLPPRHGRKKVVW